MQPPSNKTAGKTNKQTPPVSHSLEMLEKLSLTRDEWIEYFKTKQLPKQAEMELAKLQAAQRYGNAAATHRVSDFNHKFTFSNTAAPFVTKL